MTKKGDDSFHEVVSPAVDRLYRTAVLLNGGDHHQAEDLVQTILAKLYAHRGWRKIEHPAAYLHTMLVNEHISRRRRRATKETVTAELPARSVDQHAEEDPVVYLDLFRALTRLSRIDRTIVVLRYWDDLSVAETAQLTGLSAGAVRNRAARALPLLRTALPGYQPTSPQPAGRAPGPPQGESS